MVHYMVLRIGFEPMFSTLERRVCLTATLTEDIMVGGEGFEPPVLPLRNGFTVRRRTTVSAAHLNYGGRSRIRTHDTREGMLVFKTRAINHSAILPL